MKKSLFLIFIMLCFTGCEEDIDNNAIPAEVAQTNTAKAPAQNVATEPQAETIPPQPLQNVPWSWQYTENTEGKRTMPDHPERYTLLLRTDGRVAVLADCNRGGTAFKETDGRIEFELIAMTKMLCPPESKSDIFVSSLRSVESYQIDQATLTLTLHDRSRMIFAPLVTP